MTVAPDSLDQRYSCDWDAFPAVHLHRGYRLLRRWADLLIAVLLLVLLSPVILAIAFAIVLDSGRPVTFRQRRAGRWARPFTIVKFRTMSTAAPAASLKVSDDNPLITRVGRLLRKSGLDELPNLWNVLRGDMALIGPRPEQYELLDRYDTWQHERHVVKPGITGWWQVHHRDNIPLHLNVERDIYYVRNQSLALDVAILRATLVVLISAIARRRGRLPLSGFSPLDRAHPLDSGDRSGGTSTTRMRS